MSYGSFAGFGGVIAKDKFCLKLGSCVDLEFLYADEHWGGMDESVDAILGFARPNENVFWSG